jgi:hypothetical protein
VRKEWFVRRRGVRFKLQVPISECKSRSPGSRILIKDWKCRIKAVCAPWELLASNSSRPLKYRCSQVRDLIGCQNNQGMEHLGTYTRAMKGQGQTLGCGLLSLGTHGRPNMCRRRARKGKRTQ